MVNNITDPAYLRTDQYKNSGNLSKRANFHRIYGTNSVNWHKWLMGKMNLPENALILELGSGPGYFWEENKKTIPVGWEIVLTDISGGMLEEARSVLKGKTQFMYSINDAQEISFSRGFFSAVIANHMLYHVRDLNLSLRAIHQVLKEGGSFFAATNGRNHLMELRLLETEYFQDEMSNKKFWAEDFNLENGKTILSNWFGNISCHKYPNILKVTDPDAIITYFISKSSHDLDPDSVARLSAFLHKEVNRTGFIEVSSEGGLFSCKKI